MAPVFANYSYALGTNFISATPVATDPSERIQVALEAWMTAMGGQGPSGCGLTLVNSPNQCTTKAAATTVGWLIQEHIPRGQKYRDILTATGGVNTVKDLANNTNGFLWGWRAGNSTNVNDSRGAYHSYINNVSNNNAGTWTSSTGSVSSLFLDLSIATTMYISYEAAGANPWFFVGNAPSTASAGGQLLMKLDKSTLPANTYTGGGYATNWLYVHFNGTLSACFTAAPLGHNAAVTGIGGGGILTATRSESNINNYFTAIEEAFGGRKSHGLLPQDVIVISTSGTGVYGDTVVIEGKTYMKIHSNTWARIA